ncbi:hypothetical protein [Streptomyces sp. Go-475]|uniref:hypothetical protein n=1 Tax=Streptomyces sp. Go-475 TaxID=2072505 RepID=UPI000DF0C33D|nr:hypothetical protein [Streptomyces sp. Go-475]AXE85149.1 hypothetical protein C1703_09080 [Streptomyces sp. Go-475]
MISPDDIPTFTGDLVALQQHIASLRRAAKAIRDGGGEVHTRFQRLAPSYTAPEAEQLLATTQPVESRSSSFADDLETVAAALTTHVVEVAEIVKRLETLRGQALVFVESVKGDDGLVRNWQQDQDKVDEHQEIWEGVNAAVAAFQQAEVACADKITALVGGTQWHINDGSPKQDNPYGFSAEQLGEADRLPWGTPAHHEALPFGIDYHLQEVGVSLWDNAAGSVEGLIDLFSPGEEGDATREGLVRAIVGMESYLLDPHGDREGTGPWNMPFARESRPFAKEFAKGLVGWDDWQTNPGKAFGTVLFNGLTLGAGPLGAAAKGASAAGRAGAGARVAGTLAKVGEVLDPVGAAARTAGAAARALPRVADLTAGVRAATEAAAAADSSHSVLRLSDGSELRIADGEFIPGKNGVVDNTPAQPEAPATERTPPAESPRDRALVGVGARAPEATAHTGGSLTPGAGHESPAGGGSGTPGGSEAPRRSGTAPAHTTTSGTSSSGGLPHGPNAGDVHGRDGVDPGGADGARDSASDGHHTPAHEDGPDHSDAQRHEEHGESAAPDEAGAHDEPKGPDVGDREPDFTRPALPPGQAELSLRELRALRSGRHRHTTAEEIGREMFGGGPERHYPVPTHDHPYYPVEAPRGRKVDVPVDLPDGRTLAVEIKHYLEYRTVKLADGSNKIVKGEVPLKKEIMEQINKDLTLRRMDPGYDPRWVFMHAPPSQALRNYLIQARIIFVEYGPPPK